MYLSYLLSRGGGGIQTLWSQSNLLFKKGAKECRVILSDKGKGRAFFSVYYGEKGFIFCFWEIAKLAIKEKFLNVRT